jgi:hypothetical protein
MTLTLLAGRLMICRLEPDAGVPAWATGPLTSITRTEQELSVVCADAAVAEEVRCERGWRAFRIEGPLDFGLVGILASVLEPMAREKIPVLAVGTFDTDYVLLKQEHTERAAEALTRAGHVIHRAGGLSTG